MHTPQAISVRKDGKTTTPEDTSPQMTASPSDPSQPPVGMPADSWNIAQIIVATVATVFALHWAQKFFIPLLLDQFTPGEDNVLAILIDFDHFEFVSVANKTRQVSGWDDINLGGGQEGFDTDVDEQTTFDHGLDFAGDGAAFVADGEDFVPVLFELGLFLGQNDHAILVFEFFNEDVNFIAHLDGLDVLKFAGGDGAFALVTDIHKNFLGTDFNNSASGDFACGKALIALLQGFFHCEHNDD